VHKALRYLTAEVRLVRAPGEIGDAAAMVLPGVGAFDDCANALRKQELFEPCRAFIRAGKPFLGICVGYQILFERSEEFESEAPGLGVFEGSVVRFEERPGLKIPQIGWNQVEVIRAECPLFLNIPVGSYFYFVHSFFPRPKDPDLAVGRTVHGQPFVSAVWRDNVFATQFHPEKSQQVGLQLLDNFVRLAAAV